MNVTLFRDLPTEHWLSMERYADELARELPKLGCSIESFVAERPFPHLRGAINTFSNYAWRSLIYPFAASRHQHNVNHIIDHSYAHLIHSLDASRTVITCHDLAPLALDEGHGIGRKLWEDSFRAMQNAACIIADSAFTRNEILRLSDYPAERVHVVPLAASAEFFESIPGSEIATLRARYQLGNRKIILHVGACPPRKNVKLVLYALNDLRDLNIVFVQIGGQFTPSQFDLIASLDLNERVTQLPPTFGRALSAWYHAADLFVFPSFYEGFGMPVVEAMAANVPVICACVSSLPEIAGDAAVLIDPYDPHALAGAIRSALTDSTVANDLRARGARRAKIFTWERTARETLKVYEQIS